MERYVYQMIVNWEAGDPSHFYAAEIPGVANDPAQEEYMEIWGYSWEEMMEAGKRKAIYYLTWLRRQGRPAPVQTEEMISKAWALTRKYGICHTEEEEPAMRMKLVELAVDLDSEEARQIVAEKESFLAKIHRKWGPRGWNYPLYQDVLNEEIMESVVKSDFRHRPKKCKGPRRCRNWYKALDFGVWDPD